MNIRDVIEKNLAQLFATLLFCYTFFEAGNLTLNDIAYNGDKGFLDFSNMIIFFTYIFISFIGYGCGTWLTKSIEESFADGELSGTEKTKLFIIFAIYFLVIQGTVLLNIYNTMYKSSHITSINDAYVAFKQFEFKGTSVRSFIMIELSMVFSLFVSLFSVRERVNTNNRRNNQQQQQQNNYRQNNQQNNQQYQNNSQPPQPQSRYGNRNNQQQGNNQNNQEYNQQQNARNNHSAVEEYFYSVCNMLGKRASYNSLTDNQRGTLERTYSNSSIDNARKESIFKTVIGNL